MIEHYMLEVAKTIKPFMLMNTV